MCGEHTLLAAVNPRFSGSSPHVRGTHGEWSADETDRGIIPACAGNTRAYPVFALNGEDHPRMCGEH